MQLITHLGTHVGLGLYGLGPKIPINMGKGRVEFSLPTIASKELLILNVTIVVTTLSVLWVTDLCSTTIARSALLR